MKQSIILGLLAVVNAVDTNTYKYMQYLSKFGKSHSTMEEFNMRLANFIEIDAKIEEWNSDATNTSSVGHNFFSDWTAEEKLRLSNAKANSAYNNSGVSKHVVDLQQTIPTYWNWTAQGVVPNVGNQE